LLKKFEISAYTNYPYVKYNSMTQSTQYVANSNIINQGVVMKQPQMFYSQRPQNVSYTKTTNITNVSAQPQYQYPRADNPPVQSNMDKLSLDENKLINLENENKMIKVGHEKLKNDINRLIQEMKKLKEENEVYKTDHDSLTKENSILKNESDNYKKQMIIFQEENTALKKQLEEVNNQFASYNKDMDAVENQNNEIRKMYEDLENEYNQYKSQTEDINKQNELLRAQIEELNNNFTMINKELENIRNENDIFKSNLEQQSKNLNGDMINKLIEENNILKEKVEENEYLKRQIEELRYQKRQESQEKEDEDHEQVQERENEQEQENQGGEEEEEKGEIIHDMKELELITDKINKENKKIIINLLYKASVDGDKASIFHQKCDQAKSTIVLVETLNGKRFGGFTTCSWAGNCEDKNDPQSFIFSLDKMETYDNIPGDEAIGCYPKFGPIFLGCQIKIFDNAFSKGGTTFEKELNFNTKEDYELTGGDRVFQIKEIEVYEVIIE
jgi:archaellum component FlaC